MKNAIVAPSILAADLGNFNQDLELINESQATWIHIDVMDGSFVPPITFGDNIVKVCKQHSQKFLDVHLMIENPAKHFIDFIKAGAGGITFHLEATNQPSELLANLKQHGIQAGLAIKPNTPFELFKDLIAEADLLLIMTVEPGYGGQKFLPDMLSKIKLSANLIKEKKLSTKIQVDGGINLVTAKECLNAGAEVLVAGPYIFNHHDPLSQIQTLSF